MKMKIYNMLKRCVLPLVALLCVMGLAMSCSDDYAELKPGYGYAQFKLYKSADASNAPGNPMTKALGDDRLDSMSQAAKIQVVLLHEGQTVTQTVELESYDGTTAEYGLTSGKLELQAGSYTLVGFYLFDKAENQILAGEPKQRTDFVVEDGGLTVQSVDVNALHRGRVHFALTKDLTEFKTSRASGGTYLFSSVGFVDVTLENTYTGKQTEFKKLKVSYKEEYRMENGKAYTSGVGVIDTIVSVEAGPYRVVRYATRPKTDASSTLGIVQADDETRIGKDFNVKDNVITDAEVPVTIHKADANIQDYYALKEIWDGLKGPQWSFSGESYPKGTNWNFNKDIDMWGDQPGVALNGEGRVTSLNIGDFNPQGAVPAAIGNLSELTILTLGTHNDLIGGVNPSAAVKGHATKAQLAAIRADYYNRVLKRAPMQGFSSALILGEQRHDEKRGVKRDYRPIRPKDVQVGDLTNGITSIPAEVGNLTKLEQFYVANGKVADLPSTLSQLQNCRDVEVYNCPFMKKVPAVLANMPNMEALNFAMNPQISSADIVSGMKTIANGAAGKTLQILYMGHNNMTEIPAEFSKMKKMGKIDFTYNKIKTVHPFGTDVNLVQVTMDHNQIETIPSNFCGVEDVEEFTFSYNKLKKFPNIFDAKSAYVISSVDFSFNQIDGFDGAASLSGVGSFKGVNASEINLSYNRLTAFPSVIFKTNSPVAQLGLAGNQISSFTNKDVEGKKLNYLSSLDLSYNHLSELPSRFEATYFPYLYGIDLSYNRFKNFQFVPLNIANLTVYSFRYQRDANGNRIMREWPTGIARHTGLRALYLGGNDIRQVPETETISYLIYNLDISDNPNIYINVKDVCPYIKSGVFKLYYDRTQNIVGCDALTLDK